jgi:hypothetical protein
MYTNKAPNKQMTQPYTINYMSLRNILHIQVHYFCRRIIIVLVASYNNTSNRKVECNFTGNYAHAFFINNWTFPVRNIYKCNANLPNKIVYLCVAMFTVLRIHLSRNFRKTLYYHKFRKLVILLHKYKLLQFTQSFYMWCTGSVF